MKIEGRNKNESGNSNDMIQSMGSDNSLVYIYIYIYIYILIKVILVCISCSFGKFRA